jgi:hypothetical protein
VANLRGPARATSDEAIQRPRLPLERQHDVETSAGLQDSCDLPQHKLRRFDVLEHVEDPDEVDFAVSERQFLCFCGPEVDPFRRRLCDSKRRAAHVAADHLQVGSFALDRFGHRARTAPDVQHPAANGRELGQQVAQLQTVHEPRPRPQRSRAPALGLVIERRRYWPADLAALQSGADGRGASTPTTAQWASAIEPIWTNQPGLYPNMS